LHLYFVTDSPEEGVKEITRFYRNFQSTRFVKERLVMRLKHVPTSTALSAMNKDFSDIIVDGKIEVIQATPDEVEDNDNLELKRIAFNFNRRDYGRLRQLVDILNGL